MRRASWSGGHISIYARPLKWALVGPRSDARAWLCRNRPPRRRSRRRPVPRYSRSRRPPRDLVLASTTGLRRLSGRTDRRQPQRPRVGGRLHASGRSDYDPDNLALRAPHLPPAGRRRAPWTRKRCLLAREGDRRSGQRAVANLVLVVDAVIATRQRLTRRGRERLDGLPKRGYRLHLWRRLLQSLAAQGQDQTEEGGRLRLEPLRKRDGLSRACWPT